MAMSPRGPNAIVLSPLIPTPVESKPVNRSQHRPSWKAWVWELAALCFAILLALPALAILIAYFYTLRETPDFGHGITVNTVISILGNIFTACVGLVIASCMAQLKWLHFTSRPRSLIELNNLDQASHGIFGALKLLFWNPVASPLIILTASLLCIKGLVGPALQQIIHQGTISQNLTNSQYSIPACNNFNMLEGVFGSEVDPQLESAVLRGAFETQAQPFNISPIIPEFAGNATWARNWTLAVCSECQDISSQIAATSHPGNFAQYWTLSLPNGHRLDTSPVPGNYNIPSINPDGGFPLPDRFYEFNISGSQSQSVAFKGRSNVLSDFTAIFMPGRAEHASSAKAWECILRFCVQQVSASLIDGHFMEESTESTELFTVANYPERPDGSDWNPWLIRDMDGAVKPSDAKTLALTKDDENNQHIVLSYYAQPAQLLASYLRKSVFNGTIVAAVAQMKDGNNQPLDAVRSSIEDSTSEVIKALYNAAYPTSLSPNSPATIDLPNMVANIAHSITASLRERNGSSIALPAAATWKTTAFFELRWEWALFPVAIAVLAVAVFALTWRQTAARGIGTWKDSILAAMFLGIGDEVRGLLPRREDVSVEELEAFARDVRCCCCAGEGCTLRLVQDAPTAAQVESVDLHEGKGGVKAGESLDAGT